MTSALSERKATFLSEPEWISGPWKLRHKDVVDTAMDILAKVPGVLEDWDFISTHTSTRDTLVEASVFRHKCSKIDLELRLWYSNFVSVFEHAHPMEAEVLLNGTDDPAQQARIPDMLAKIELRHLHAMMIHWTASILLYATMDLVDNQFPMASRLDREVLISPGTRIIQYLVCIAHGARHFLGSEMGLFGPLIISHTGTGLVCGAYEHQRRFPEADPTDLEELRRVMKVVRGLKGFNA